MDFIIDAIVNVLNMMSAALRGFNWTRNLAQDVQTIADYIEKANMILPISTALTILGIFVALELVMIAYYWITRTINLIRGAG